MNTKEKRERERRRDRMGEGKGKRDGDNLLFFLKVKRNRVGNEEKAQGLRGLTVKS